tara:strand:- start:81 stop:227 length:147 start_codon:yes stop_codon:yes gene_type:complete
MTKLTTREEIDNLKQYTSFLKKEIEELRDRLEQLYENQNRLEEDETID